MKKKINDVMMRQRISMSIGCLLMAFLSFGQTSIQEINAIKRDKNCIYAEATMATEKEASELAQELLVRYIEDYLKEDSLKGSYSNFVVKDIVGKSEKLSMKRGEMTRVFLYVKKKDIIPAKNLMTLQKKQSKQTSEKKPLPVKTKPKAIPDNCPGVVAELMKAPTAKDALVALDRLKNEYKVKRYGSYGDCKDISDSYWLILNDNNTICAILGKGQDERVNFITNTNTSLKAYSGKSAVWFTLNDN